MAHVNAVADEMSQRKDQPPHVLGILLEQEVRLKDGKFELVPTIAKPRNMA